MTKTTVKVAPSEYKGRKVNEKGIALNTDGSPFAVWTQAGFFETKKNKSRVESKTLRSEILMREHDDKQLLTLVSRENNGEKDLIRIQPLYLDSTFEYKQKDGTQNPTTTIDGVKYGLGKGPMIFEPEAFKALISAGQRML